MNQVREQASPTRFYFTYSGLQPYEDTLVCLRASPRYKTQAKGLYLTHLQSAVIMIF
jgi:hypothetical protein